MFDFSPFKLIGNITDTLSRDINLMLDREVRIGVTGLSQGGKSTLITALVNLFNVFGEPGLGEKIPRFTLYDELGFTYGGICRQHDMQIPTFPYHEAYAALTQTPPSWPAPTVGVSEIRLELRYRNRDFIALNDEKTIYLDIWDYPGEWLMDLMLLNMDYKSFSARILERLQRLKNVTHTEDFLSTGSQLKAGEPVNESLLHRVVLHYVAWLKECKEKGLAMVVPGRFVLPGDLQGAPILEFIPWVFGNPSSVRSNSLYALLEERYNAYREKVVKRFYNDCFAKLDRQIILVDCLKALKGGRETFMDINDTFDVLLENFSYGRNNLLTRLFSPQIDKVIFAASKADLITYNEHQHLLSLLRSMVSQASKRVRADGSNCEFMILSAIAASRCLYAEHEGQKVQILATDYDDEAPFYPGSVPETWSHEAMEFFQKYFFLKELRPPKIRNNAAFPHLNLDVLLDYLLSDKL